MRKYAPMKVSTVGIVADVIMGGRKHSGRGNSSYGRYSSRSQSRPKRTR